MRKRTRRDNTGALSAKQVSATATPSEMRALGVHIFAGGFSIGAEKHFQLQGHLERSEFGADSWRRYRPGVPVHVDKDAKWEAAIAEHHGKVDLVYGNPPCAPWSGASACAKKRGADSDYMRWTEDVVRVAKEVGAKSVVIESVRGALRGREAFYDPLWQQYRDAFPAQMWVLVNAVDHGLAQWRPRLFWVLGQDVFKPVPRFTPRKILDVIKGAPACEPWVERDIRYCQWQWRMIPHMESGKGIRSLAQAPNTPDDVKEFLARDNLISMFLLKKLHPDEPAPVVWGGRGHMRMVHPTEPRLLTLRELMRLSGYPDDFNFIWKRNADDQVDPHHPRDEMGDDCSQLGKTVCPPVGEWIVGEVRAYLEDRRQVRGPGTAVFDCSTRSRDTIGHEHVTTQQMTIDDWR